MSSVDLAALAVQGCRIVRDLVAAGLLVVGSRKVAGLVLVFRTVEEVEPWMLRGETRSRGVL